MINLLCNKKHIFIYYLKSADLLFGNLDIYFMVKNMHLCSK
jgi:hypothetical protein